MTTTTPTASTRLNAAVTGAKPAGLGGKVNVNKGNGHRLWVWQSAGVAEQFVPKSRSVELCNDGQHQIH